MLTLLVMFVLNLPADRDLLVSFLFFFSFFLFFPPFLDFQQSYEIPEEERPQLSMLVQQIRQMLQILDQTVLQRLRTNPAIFSDDSLRSMYRMAAVLRIVLENLSTRNVLVIKFPELKSARQKLREDITRYFGAASNAQSGGDALAATTNTPSPGTDVLAPRLRVEDLKPPPAKRQRTMSKDSVASPPVTAAPVAKVKAGNNGHETLSPLSKSVTVAESPSRMSIPQPIPEKKTPKKKVNKKKAAKDQVDQKPVIAAEKPKEVVDQNALGIRLGEQAMQARLDQELQGQKDPLAFMASAWDKLQAVLSANGQAQADVLTSIATDLNPLNTSYHGLGVQAIPPQPQPVEAPFDYSSFIDESALDFMDDLAEQPTTNLQATSTPTVPSYLSGSLISQTPDLVGGGPSTVDPSPPSDFATSPASPTTKMDPTYSPVDAKNEFDLFNDENGWLGELGQEYRWA